MVFIGEYIVSFSAPGRIVLPKKIRELLDNTMFILSKGFNFCLAGYSRKDWEQRTHELLNVSLLDNQELEKRRFLFSSAAYVEVDDQGRFVITKNLLEHAGLEKQVVIIGAGDHFEIWNPKKWEDYQKGMIRN